MTTSTFTFLIRDNVGTEAMAADARGGVQVARAVAARTGEAAFIACAGRPIATVHPDGKLEADIPLDVADERTIGNGAVWPKEHPFTGKKLDVVGWHGHTKNARGEDTSFAYTFVSQGEADPKAFLRGIWNRHEWTWDIDDLFGLADEPGL